MNVLMTILYILLFIVCLSLLIMIHELGHFTAAKIFKVYCLDFSIGFGPAFFRKKRKNGETYFSLRVIPFGGYVAMYGEGAELPEGTVIDESRSLEGIKKWKRAIILVAGVTMNAILALHLFFINNIAFREEQLYLRNMTVAAESKAEQAGLKTLDVIALDDDVTTDSSIWHPEENRDLHLLDPVATVTYNDSSFESAFAFIDTSGIKNFKDITLNHFIVLYGSNTDGTVNYAKPISVDANFYEVYINFMTVTEFDEKGKGVTFEDHPIAIRKDETGGLEDFGYSFYHYIGKQLNFFEAVGKSFVDFGESSTLIVRAFATLFTKETWSSVGGIVAIGFQSTSVLQNLGLGKYIYLWGALSVNLAIVNLFPFPGLDGWQLLVLAVEAIFRKKIPNKVKTIVSIVGLVILFAFMGVILIKDLITYVF